MQNQQVNGVFQHMAGRCFLPKRGGIEGKANFGANSCPPAPLIHFDLNFEKSMWRISPERTKMRRVHDIPLSRQALAVLEDIWSLSDLGELIFPSLRTHTRSLSDNAFNSALRRMGFAKDEMTAHGFRASASTMLNENGFNPDVIEAALGHQNENEMRRAYNRASHWKERVEMMQKWANMLDASRQLPPKEMPAAPLPSKAPARRKV